MTRDHLIAAMREREARYREDELIQPWMLIFPEQPDGPQSMEDRYMGREAKS